MPGDGKFVGRMIHSNHTPSLLRKDYFNSERLLLIVPVKLAFLVWALLNSHSISVAYDKLAADKCIFQIS